VASVTTPYGERSGPQTSFSNVAEFAGHPNEAALGLVRAGVRDYDPTLGRFWQVDTFLLESPELCAGNPAQCSLTGYAANDPINYVDPNGQFVAPIIMAVVAAIAGLIAGAIASGGNYVGVTVGGSHDIAGGGSVPSPGSIGVVTSVSVNGGLPSHHAGDNGGASGPTISAAPPAPFISKVPIVGTVYGGVKSGVNNARIGEYSTAAHDFVDAGLAAIDLYGMGGVLKASVVGIFSLAKEMPRFIKGMGNIGSHGPVPIDDVLAGAERWLGQGYKEIGPKGSGVFRSADNMRQFRMTAQDLNPVGHGAKSGIGSHVHFEALDKFGEIIENLHVPLLY
jgi:RHS repeat-associated protein